MSKDDVIEMQGTVLEALPNATFQVELESSTVTLSPGKILMKFILNFPDICAKIT